MRIMCVAFLAVLALGGVDAKASDETAYDRLCAAMEAVRDGMDAADDAGNEILEKRARIEARQRLLSDLEAVGAGSGGGVLVGVVAELDSLSTNDDATEISLVFEGGCDIILRTPVDAAIPDTSPLFDRLVTLREGEDYAIAVALIPANDYDRERGFPFSEYSLTEAGAYRAPEFAVDLIEVAPADRAGEMRADRAMYEETLADRRADRAEAERAAEAICRSNEACWFSHHLGAAEKACVPMIEQQLTATFEWTNSWLDSRFTHGGWADEARGTMKYAGDALQFQSVTGGWLNAIYLCTYDPESGEAVGVMVEVGRL